MRVIQNACSYLEYGYCIVFVLIKIRIRIFQLDRYLCWMNLFLLFLFSVKVTCRIWLGQIQAFKEHIVIQSHSDIIDRNDMRVILSRSAGNSPASVMLLSTPLGTVSAEFGSDTFFRIFRDWNSGKFPSNQPFFTTFCKILEIYITISIILNPPYTKISIVESSISEKNPSFEPKIRQIAIF